MFFNCLNGKSQIYLTDGLITEVLFVKSLSGRFQFKAITWEMSNESNGAG